MNPLKPMVQLAISCVAAASLASSASADTSRDAQGEPSPQASTASAPGTASAALTLASEIVALGYPEDTREELFFKTMDQTVIQMRAAIAPTLPQDDPGAIAILDEWIAEYTKESKEVLRQHIPDIMAGMTQAYASIFTVEELRDILAFVRTPSGQRYFELSPSVLGEQSFAEANQRYLDDSMALIGPAQRELMQRLDKHMEQKRAKDAAPDT